MVVDNIACPPMDGQSSIPTTSNSIALLQERFRQLQRAKKMRQERELLQLLAESERLKTTSTYEPTGLFLYSEQIPPHHSSLFHQPYMQSKHANLRVIETPLLVNLYSADTTMQNTNNYHDADVDTSLHL